METQITIDKVASSDWQMSNDKYGYIAQGADDILMSIHNILFTMKGELPFSPFFGSDMYKMIDMPINSIIAPMVSELIDAIRRWEPRVVVNAIPVTTAADFSSILFTIQMTVVSTSSPLGYELTLNNIKGNRRAFSDGFASGSFE